MTPKQASLSKFYRMRATLKFLLIHIRNVSAWSRDDLERGRLAFQCRELTWRIIDLDEQIRDWEYGLDIDADGNVIPSKSRLR